MNIYNFSAGPALLPKSVLEKAKNDLTDWKGSGLSIASISHRSDIFNSILNKIKKRLKETLDLPKDYTVLFSHGGARGQFSAIPMNLIKGKCITDYANSGYWSYNALREAKKYCSVNEINVLETKNDKISVVPMSRWTVNDKSLYIHYCPNETANGISINEEPKFPNKTIIADFSSTILSKQLNIKNYDIIYASSQKNISIAGFALIIIKNDLIPKNINVNIPSILDYKVLKEHKSIFNTPVTFSLYIFSLVLKWINTTGGLKKMEQLNKKKSNVLYHAIDNSKIYYNNIDKSCRSKINIVFNIRNKTLEKHFIHSAEKFGIYGLKGHTAIGGIRASIYNAMPMSGVLALTKFMKIFEKNQKKNCFTR